MPLHWGEWPRSIPERYSAGGSSNQGDNVGRRRGKGEGPKWRQLHLSIAVGKSSACSSAKGIANFAVMVAKATVGFHTGSIAVIGDAIHSLADLANNARRVCSDPHRERTPRSRAPLRASEIRNSRGFRDRNAALGARDRNHPRCARSRPTRNHARALGPRAHAGRARRQCGDRALGKSLGAAARLGHSARGRPAHDRRRFDDDRSDHRLATRRTRIPLARCTRIHHRRRDDLLPRVWALPKGDPRSGRTKHRQSPTRYRAQPRRSMGSTRPAAFVRARADRAPRSISS